MLKAPRLERTERGVSVVEVVVAVSILLLVFVATGRATASAISAQGRAASRDRALAAAYDIGDLLQVEGCLQLTGAETTSDHEAVAQRCGAALGMTGAIGVGGGAHDEGSAIYSFSYSSRWIAGDGPAGPVGCADPHYGRRPTGVEWTVDVAYRERTTVRSRTRATHIDSVPPDGYVHRSSQRSNLVVAAGDPAAVVDLIGSSGGGVRRAADPNGCVWLPSLRTDTYRLRSTTSRGTSTSTLDFVADPRMSTARQVSM